MSPSRRWFDPQDRLLVLLDGPLAVLYLVTRAELVYVAGVAVFLGLTCRWGVTALRRHGATISLARTPWVAGGVACVLLLLPMAARLPPEFQTVCAAAAMPCLAYVVACWARPALVVRRTGGHSAP